MKLVIELERVSEYSDFELFSCIFCACQQGNKLWTNWYNRLNNDAPELNICNNCIKKLEKKKKG